GIEFFVIQSYGKRGYFRVLSKNQILRSFARLRSDVDTVAPRSSLTCRVRSQTDGSDRPEMLRTFGRRRRRGGDDGTADDLDPLAAPVAPAPSPPSLPPLATNGVRGAEADSGAEDDPSSASSLGSYPVLSQPSSSQPTAAAVEFDAVIARDFTPAKYVCL